MTTYIDQNMTPAPWASVRRSDHGEFFVCIGLTVIGSFRKEADADAAAMLRNAMDVQMRRGWFAAVCMVDNDGKVIDMRTAVNVKTWKQKWDVMIKLAHRGGGPDFCGSMYTYYGSQVTGKPFLTILYDDPATALIEAEKWYVANVEASK